MPNFPLQRHILKMSYNNVEAPKDYGSIRGSL